MTMDAQAHCNGPGRQRACGPETATAILRGLMGLCLGVLACHATAGDADSDVTGRSVTPSLVYDGDVAKVPHGGEGTGPTLAAFTQLGAASLSTNRFQSYVGMGLVATGRMPGRPADQLGVAVASARNGSPYLESQWARGQPSTAPETTLELSYLTQIAKGFTVQPDLQYVTHPNTDGALCDAWVAQLRFEMSF